MNYPAPFAIETPSMQGSERTEVMEMPTESVPPTQRWTAKQHVALVGKVRKGEIDLPHGTGGKHGLTVA